MVFVHGPFQKGVNFGVGQLFGFGLLQEAADGDEVAKEDSGDDEGGQPVEGEV